MMTESNRKQLIAMQMVALVLITALVLAGPAAAAEKKKKKDRFFTVTLMAPIGNEPREKAAQIIARDLEKIGIGVNLRYVEYASMAPRQKVGAGKGLPYSEGGYDMLLTRSHLNAFPDPTGIYRRYACDQFFPEGNNRTRYCNPEFDKFIYKALYTVDEQKRMDIAREAFKVMRDDLPSIPLYRPSQFFAIKDEIKFPKDKNTRGYKSYAYRWARREVSGKTKEQMNLRERTLIATNPSSIDCFLDGFSKSNYQTRAIDYVMMDSLIVPTDATYAAGPKSEHGIKPALAKSWTISEDGLVWTIRLQENALWHDGKKCTADDVIFTYDLINNKKARYGSNKFMRKNGITCRKIDDYTVEFAAKKFSPLFPMEVLEAPILPKHLLGEIPPEDLAKSKYNTATMVGTGPWILEEYNPAEYLKFKANDKYFGGRPWFDYLVIRFIPKASTAWLSLKTGEIDVVDSTYALTRQLDEIKVTPELRAEMEMAVKTQFIRINISHPQLKNVYIRHAISLACNRKAMVDVISYGLGEPANQHVPEWSAAAVDAGPLEYDLEKAKHMLIKAGYDYDDILVDGPKK